MGFESLFKSGVEKSEEDLAIERATADIQRRIQEKTGNPEVARFFDEKDGQNLKVLESHAQSDLNRTFRLSRDLMHLVKQTPQIIDEKVRFFRQRIG